MFLALALTLLRASPSQSEPLFAFVQMSDSQPRNSADQAQFEGVLEAIADSGRNGALLPEPVAFVLFAGDLVDQSTTAEWNDFVATVDEGLTANGIPLLAVPGNHDQTNGVTLYESFIGDSAPWSVGSTSFLGQNGVAGSTPWRGLRFIGLNNSNGDANQVSTTDRQRVENLLAEAVAADENVFLIAHHPHDASNRVPLRDALQTPGVVGYMRGHSGPPRARRGLTGIVNPDLFEFNTNSTFEDGALVYFEAFTGELHAYVLELRTNPTRLPTRVVVPLVHPLRAEEPDGPGTTRLEPVADAHVHSSRPSENFGSEPELRLRQDGSTLWRSYLRFDLDALGGAVPVAARLRLYCTKSSSDGGAIHATSPAWSEAGLTYVGAPAPAGGVLAGPRSVSSGTWYEYDLSTAVLAGVEAFVLVSVDSNGAIYSSREGAHPPELVVDHEPEAPLSIASVSPGTVAVFVPGTLETVRVTGAGFGLGTVVELDGTPLDPGSFTRVDSGLLTLDLPPTAIGSHTLGVRRGTHSDSRPIQVVLPATPLLEVGSGDSGNFITGGQPARLLVSGPIGSRQVVLMSPSLAQSTSSLMDLLIGANFSDLRVAAIVSVPAEGFAALDFVANPSVPVLVFAQSIALGPTPPFPASNLQSVQLVPSGAAQE